MVILVQAVGPTAFSQGARLEAREWSALMARKRRWRARAGFVEQQRVALDQGPQDLKSTRGQV